MQNGEHTDEWPAADRPFSVDDSDAPVTMGESSMTDETTIPAPDDAAPDDVAPGDASGDTEPPAYASSSPDSPWPGVGETADDAAAVATGEIAPDLAPTDEAMAYAAADASDNGESAAGSTDAGADITDADNVEITNGGARDIDATTVNITQGGARDIEATNVTINQGGAARVNAEQVTVSQGGVALARAEQLTLQEGGSAFVVVADKAQLDAETSVFLLISGSASGEVKPVLDWRAALAIGAGFALVLSALRRLRR
jgi:hypothetical protein